ncbi:hypothetical protein Tco_0611118 [Tanacetum coccineum]
MLLRERELELEMSACREVGLTITFIQHTSGILARGTTLHPRTLGGSWSNLPYSISAIAYWEVQQDSEELVVVVDVVVVDDELESECNMH